MSWLKKLWKIIRPHLPDKLESWLASICIALLAVLVFAMLFLGYTLWLPWGCVRITHSTTATNEQVPLGTILSFYGYEPPTGYLICNGDLVPKEFEDLQAYLLATNSALRNDDNTVRLPNLQGYFLRGLDKNGDTDREGKERSIGSIQEPSTGQPANEHFTITTEKEEDGINLKGHGHAINAYPLKVAPGTLDAWGNQPGSGGKLATAGGKGDGAHYHIAENWDDETRPRNVAVNFIIRAIR